MNEIDFKNADGFIDETFLELTNGKGDDEDE